MRYSDVRHLLLALLLALPFLSVPAAPASAGDEKALITAVAEGNFQAKAKAIEALAATGNAALVPFFEALSDGRAYLRRADHTVLMLGDAGLADPLTGAVIGPADTAGLDKIKVNNNLRRSLKAAISALSMTSTDPAARRAALTALIKTPDPAKLSMLEDSLKTERMQPCWRSSARRMPPSFSNPTGR